MARTVHLFAVAGQRGQAPYGDLLEKTMASLREQGITVNFLGFSQVAGHLPQTADNDIIEIAMSVCEQNDLVFSSRTVEYKLHTQGSNALGAIYIEGTEA